jgi:UDP-N-acetylglucosamine acyltransferase
MPTIHPSAIVSPEAELADDAIVHPYCIIEAGVRVGAGCKIGPMAVLRTGTIIGAGTEVHTGVVLGEPPQDLKYKGEPTELIIGEGNQIREFVTLHRATGEGQATVVGDRNMIMAYSHFGHNCRIGNDCLIANGAGVSGHCTLEDYVTIGGMVGVHQFVTFGTMCMVGAMSGMTRDVPPYCMVDGKPMVMCGLNVRGLRRRGLTAEEIDALHHAYKVLFRSDLNTSQALDQLEAEGAGTPQVLHLADFMRRSVQGSLGRQAAHA